MSEYPRPISRRDAMRGSFVVAAGTRVIAPIDTAQAQTLDYPTLQAAQGAANSKPGPRTVPAKVITIPGGLDPATAALMAAPYSPLWNLNAPDDAGWRAIVKKADDAELATLAAARTALGVTIEPTKVGGISAFILAPNEIPAAHKNQLVVNLHGGGWIFGAGESGTKEAMQMAAFGGYRVLAAIARRSNRAVLGTLQGVAFKRWSKNKGTVPASLDCPWARRPAPSVQAGTTERTMEDRPSR
jgi:hypothetical protein